MLFRSEVRRLAPDLKVAAVLGDDIAPRIQEFLAKGYPLANLDTGEALHTIQDKILSANAYLGAFPLAQALATGADVVVSGRCADAALALAPAIYRFGWSPRDYDLLAAGMVAGHLIECGAQVTGGNSTSRATATTGGWDGITLRMAIAAVARPVASTRTICGAGAAKPSTRARTR